MTEDKFWQLVEKSRDESGECEAQAAALAWLLSAQSAEAIQSFDDIFAAKRADAYRWDLWGAAYLINGGCSDDGFEYFRCWLIGQGREAFMNALENPDSLADVLSGDEDDLECEDLLYSAGRAHDALPPRTYSGPSEPLGSQWDEKDLAEMFPRLAAKFP
jgi:hypothetical protein